MGRQNFPGKPNSLDMLCKRFNISLKDRTKHGALIDCILLADVYKELCIIDQKRQRQKENILTKKLLSFQPQNRKIRHFPISDEEKTAHHQLMKKIKRIFS